MTFSSIKKIITILVFAVMMLTFIVSSLSLYAYDIDLYLEFRDEYYNSFWVYNDNKFLYHSVNDTINVKVVPIRTSQDIKAYYFYIYEGGNYNNIIPVGSSSDGCISYIIPATLIGKHCTFTIKVDFGDYITTLYPRIPAPNEKDVMEREHFYVTNTNFIDTGNNSSKWYTDAVNYCSYLNMFDTMPFTNSNSFCSSKTDVTRGLVAQMISKELIDYGSHKELKFADLSKNNIYYNGIYKVCDNLVMFGSGGYFRPNDLITKQEFVTVLYNYYLQYDLHKYYKDNPYAVTSADYALLDKYVDKDSISSWAKKIVVWAIKRGVISGTPTSKGLYLNPKKTITRAEACTMISAYFAK